MVNEGEDERAPGQVRDEAGDRIYGEIRSEIQFEITLVNARVNWLVASQAFLFTPLLIGADGDGIASNPLWPAIPALGVAVCLLVTISIGAAVWRSNQWRSKLKGTAYTDERMPREFSIVMPRTPMIPAMGLVGALGIPLVLSVVWIWLLVSPP